ncbi:hypothetical protein ACO2Q8_14410 [Larkinella sp. VNQ87]|uniref:hypothetical protein n=1 Tax=Larkinella sp. VNQ87 TaxID=3400921 RepID=UPI003C096D6E
MKTAKKPVKSTPKPAEAGFYKTEEEAVAAKVRLVETMLANANWESFKKAAK